MTPSHPPSSPAGLEYTKMLFLVSHGLQTPLSAIRWGCGRLKRTGENLTEDQTGLLHDIQQQTRMLSSMFDWLLLLAKVEEGVHLSHLQQMYLSDFLQAPERLKNLPRPYTLDVTCPDDCLVKVDRVLFASIIDALLLVMSVCSTAETVPVSVHIDGSTCMIILKADMHLSLLEEAQTPDGGKKNRIVGGIPGFLLAVAASLARFIDGSLESAGQDDDVPGTLTLRLPLEPALSFDV